MTKLFCSRSNLLGTAIFLALLSTGQTAGAAEGLQKLRVAYAAITAAFALPWMAKEAGIFQRHGLDVELVYIASGARAVQTLVGGSIDVAEVGGPAGVDARLAGADTIYVALPVTRVLVFTVAAPQIQRIEDMRGKTIGVTRIGTVTDFFTRVYLRQNNLVPDKDVMIRQAGGLPEIVAALKAGQVEGGTFGFPAVLHARAAGFRVLVDYNTAGYRYPLSSVIVTQRLLRSSGIGGSSVARSPYRSGASVQDRRQFRDECGWKIYPDQRPWRCWRRRSECMPRLSNGFPIPILKR